MNCVTGWAVFFTIIFMAFGLIMSGVCIYTLTEYDEINDDYRRVMNNIRRICISGFLISFLVAICSYDYKLAKAKEDNRHLEAKAKLELDYDEFRHKAELYDKTRESLDKEILLHNQHMELLNKELEKKEDEILQLKEQLRVED